MKVLEFLVPIFGLGLALFSILLRTRPHLFSTHFFHGFMGDELSWLWILHGLSENIFELRFPLFDGKAFYPSTESYLYSEPLVFSGLVYRVFYSYFENRILAYNLTFLTFLALDYFAMYALARLFSSRSAAVFAGLVFGFSLTRLSHVAHFHLLPQFFVPLTAYAWVRYCRRPHWGWAVLSGLAVAFQCYFSFQLGILLLLTLLPFTIALLISHARIPRFWFDACLGVLTFTLLFAPLGWVYYEVHQRLGLSRTLSDARAFSVNLASFFLVPWGQIYWEWVAPWVSGIGARQEKTYFYGFVVWAMVLFGWRNLRASGSRELRWILLSLGIGGGYCFWMMWGPDAGLYSVLYSLVPMVRAMRVPGRFGLMLLFFLALGSSFGFDRVRGHFRSISAKALAVGTLLILFLIENSVSLPLMHEPVNHQGVTSFLKSLPNRDPVLFLPFEHPVEDTARMYFALDHGHPILNGLAGFPIKPHEEVKRALVELDAGRVTPETLRKRGVRYFVIDKRARFLLRAPWLRDLERVYEDATFGVYQ